MREFFQIIKTLIDKGPNLSIILLSIAISICTYKGTNDFLWSALSFCVSYPLLMYICYLVNTRRMNSRLRKENNEYEAERRRYYKERNREEKQRIQMIYSSIHDRGKMALKNLYKLPKTEGGVENKRILRLQTPEEGELFAFCQMFSSEHFDLLPIESEGTSVIIEIKPLLYQIIAEDINNERNK